MGFNNGQPENVKMTGIFTITIIQGKDKKSLMENPSAGL